MSHFGSSYGLYPSFWWYSLMSSRLAFTIAAQSLSDPVLSQTRAPHAGAYRSRVRPVIALPHADVAWGGRACGVGWSSVWRAACS